MQSIVETVGRLPESELLLLAAHVLGVDTVEQVTCWEVDPMDYASVGPGTEALLLCRGTVATNAREHDWTSVLKVVRPDAPNQYGFSSVTYSPRREIETYRSGLFNSNGTNFRGARCYDVQDREDGTVWLWLEDLSRYQGSHWTAEQYVAAARSLGAFRGACLSRDLSEFPWLNRGSRGKELKNTKLSHILRNCLAEQIDSPYLRRALPGDLYERAIGLWDHAELMVRVVNHLPATLAHNDCHVRNLFASPVEADSPEIVAIEFAGVGIEHIGVDAGDLYGSGFTWTDGEARLLMEIGDEYYSAWLDGMRSTGWKGEEELARLGFLAPIYQRAMGTAGIPAAVAARVDWWEFPLKRFDGPEQELPESFRERVEFLLPKCEEAVELAGRITD